MKSYRKILFRIIFLLAVFFCYGINVSSNYNIQLYSIEHSAEKNSVENNFIGNDDSYDDDQIIQNYEFSSIMELICLIPIPLNCFVVDKFLFSVWQPPKNY
jgi:hypothetical protein